jgi:hypothetical protein
MKFCTPMGALPARDEDSFFVRVCAGSAESCHVLAKLIDL